MGSFFSSLFGGSNPTLNKTISQLGDLSGYSQNIGQKDTTQASDYWHNILGDTAMQSKALAPEIAGQQQQIQQANNAGAQFGTRSGGTGASAVAAPAQARGNLINLVGGLQNTAAGNLANLGTTNLGMAANTNAEQAAQSQQRMQNYMNSILGKGIGSAVGAAEAFGLGGGLGALAGGPGAVAPLPGIGAASAPSVLPGAISGGYAGVSPVGLQTSSIPLSQIFG